MSCITGTFDDTKKALVEFDAGSAARGKAWGAVTTVEDVVRAEENDRLALRMVQEAFHEDTKEFNSYDNCRRVSIDFMRRVAL